MVDNFLEPYFVPRLINTTYACLKDRGMHKACIDVQKGMKHCKRIWGEYYIIKMDVAKYFQNINKSILYRILNEKIQDEKLMKLLKEIIYSNNGETGLAIGNYTSQMFANIYLNEVDQYIKQKLRCKYYYRYMDDSIVLIQTKEEAKVILEKIKDFLRIRLKLELNRLSWNAFTKDRKTMFEKKLKELGIKYKNIEPYTPKQNGKVERSFQ